MLRRIEFKLPPRGDKGPFVQCFWIGVVAQVVVPHCPIQGLA